MDDCDADFNGLVNILYDFIRGFRNVGGIDFVGIIPVGVKFIIRFCIGYLFNNYQD
jgi:hypothetical protein